MSQVMGVSLKKTKKKKGKKNTYSLVLSHSYGKWMTIDHCPYKQDDLPTTDWHFPWLYEITGG
jgi:hypothetical protein